MVAPPSVRDDGKYVWLNDAPIKNAPQWLLHLVAEEPTRRDRRPSSSDDKVNVDLLATLVAAIPNPNLDWGSWNKIGMAIYAETDGDDAGFEIFDTWSRKSSKYRASVTWKKWQSLHNSPPDRIGAGTLFFEANAAAPDWLKHFDKEQFAALERANRYWADKSTNEWFNFLENKS